MNYFHHGGRLPEASGDENLHVVDTDEVLTEVHAMIDAIPPDNTIINSGSNMVDIAINILTATDGIRDEIKDEQNKNNRPCP